MNLLPTEEQRQVAETVAGVLERRTPFQGLFGGDLSGRDVVGVLRESSDGGWLGLGLAAEAGGVGYSVVEELLLNRELGRSLAPLSILATAIAAHVAQQAGDGALAAALASGARRAGFAVALNGDGERLLLVDVDHAGYALQLGEALHLTRHDRFATASVACLDPTVQAAEARAVAADLAVEDEGLILRARLLIAGQLIGLAERARDVAVEYAKTRQQFGHAIGAFQAVKHRCSEMATRCESAFAQASAAAAALNEDLPSARLHVAAAYLTSDEAAIENARAAVQVHGAIGVTEEHALHLLVKRRHVLAQLGAGAGLEDDLLGP